MTAKKQPQKKPTAKKKTPENKGGKAVKKKITPAQKKAELEKKRLELFAHTIDLIESGLSLRKSLKISKLRKDDFYLMINEDETKRERYARAAIERAETILDEAYDIADDNRNDTKIIFDKNGDPIKIEDKEWTQRSKLRIDLRKWHVSKLNPKKYGDKIDVTSDNEKVEAVSIGSIVTNFLKGGGNT